MSQTLITQLVRRTKSLPLQKLTQNSQLIINSKSQVNVLFEPQWRDDGHVSLQAISHKHEIGKFDWSVDTREGKKAGLSTIEVNIGLLRGLENSICVHPDEEVHEEEIDAGVGVALTLTVKVPEKCNIICMLYEGGDITVNSKLEGEDGFQLLTRGGDILLNKLRGDSISLDSKFGGSTGGTIYVKKACEAQELDISVGKGGRLRAKMLNVSNANIEVEDGEMDIKKIDKDDSGALIDISSIYASQSGQGAHLAVKKSQDALSNGTTSTTKKVRIKSNHGHISVRAVSDLPSRGSSFFDEYDQQMSHVELGGVNGSFDISIERAAGDDPFRNRDTSNPMAARVHIDSLSPGQANILTSDFGDLGITLDRKIESDVRLLSTPLLNKTDPNLMLEEDENALIKELSNHDDNLEEFMSRATKIELDSNVQAKAHRIEIETEAFTGHRSSDMKYVEYVQGVIENKSHEPNSRFDVKTKGLSSGKIRIDGAAGQALSGFSGGGQTTEKSELLSNERLVDLPLLAVATDGHIKIESLSWFGAIARRYGIENEGRDLGRQAKAGAAANEKKQ